MHPRILGFFILCSQQLFSQVVFNNYATINSIGICFEIPADDPEGDLISTLYYKKATELDWKNGFELSKSNSFNSKSMHGSVFRCEANKEYHLKIVLSDASTNSLNGTFLDTIRTKHISDFTGVSKIYYVSPNGSGSQFTSNAPGTLTDAFASVQPGEKIVLLAGTYYEGNFTLGLSGTAASPIIIEGMAGEEITLDGSQQNNVWTADASVSGYKTTITNQNCNVVIADGIRLYPHKALKELKYHKIPYENTCRDALMDGFFRSGNNNTLRIKFRDNADPALKEIKIGLYDYCFKMDQAKNIVFKNISFKYYGTNNSGALVLKNAENIQVLNCKFGFNDVGILFQENTSTVIIDSSEFYDSNGNWNFWRMKATYTGTYLPNCSGNDILGDNASGSTLVNVEGNRALEKGGIFVSGNYSGKGMMISNSKFHDIVQGMSLTPQSWWTDNGLPLEIDFNNNEVYNCSEDGLEADVFPRNVRIWENQFHHCNMTISTAVGADGPTYIFNNTFHSFTTDTNWVASWGNFNPGRALKVNAGSPSEDGGALFFMHNTVYAQGDHYAMDLLKESPQKWAKFSFLNNIFQSETRPCFRLRSDSLGPIHSGSNCLSNTGSNLIEFQGNGFSDLLSYQNQYGYEAKSLNVAPQFTDAGNLDFSLLPISPLVDAGELIVGLNDQTDHCPDIGAIESHDKCNPVIPCNPTAILSGDTTICSGDSAKISIAFSANTRWSITLAIDGQDQNPFEVDSSSYEFYTSVAGLYTISILSDSGCTGTASGSATINVNSVLTASNPTTVCSANSTDYTVEFDVLGGDSTSYSVLGNTGNFISSHHFKSDPILSGTSYSFTVNDSVACAAPLVLSGTKSCDTVSIPCTATAFISGDSSICSGDSASIHIELTGHSPWLIVLARDGIDQASFYSNTASHTFYSKDAAEYTLKSVNDSANCTAICTGSAKVAIRPLPIIGSIASPASATICAGDTVQLFGTGGINYTWSDGIVDGLAFVPSASKTYTVSGEDIYKCSNTAVQEITVAPKPLVGIQMNPTADSICAGSTISLTGTGANQYTWSNGITDGQPFTINTSETYILTGTANNNCSDTVSKWIRVISCDTLTGLKEYAKQETISVFPNPSSGLFTFKFSNASEKEVFLKLFNMWGTEVFQGIFKLQQENHDEQIDLRHLPKGMYYLQLFSETKTRLLKLNID